MTLLDAGSVRICPKCTSAFPGCQIKFSITGIFSVLCNYWFLLTLCMRINNNNHCLYLLSCNFKFFSSGFSAFCGKSKVRCVSSSNYSRISIYIIYDSIENQWYFALVGVERTSAETEMFEGIDTGLIFAVCLEVCFSIFWKLLWKFADLWRGGCACLSVNHQHQYSLPGTFLPLIFLLCKPQSPAVHILL